MPFRLSKLLLVVALVALNSVPASAYDYHDLRYYDVNSLSAFAYIYTGQLYSRCNFGDPFSFITNEMWRADADGKSWAETGDVDGTVNNQCWNGGFAAYSTPTQGYNEKALVPYRPWVGWHAFEISVEANHNYVDFFYNGYYAGFARMSTNYAYQEQVGIESNSSTAGYFNGFVKGSTAAGSMQVWTGGSAWYYWPYPYHVYEYDEFWPTVYDTYGWQRSGGPIVNYY